ncbi:MAG: dihydrofolate reductase family protein, partial [Flavobacteriales bacterium]|nr:dihydrofolate reductase family protein [Flavobacteriales bacterium]
LVVGCSDPNPTTHDKGIARAREAGIEVITDVLHDDCRWLNRRFITSFEKQRPYIILKWAQSADGFLDDHGRTARISSPETDVIVHRWRAEEQAILVGSRTVLNDDPALTVRHVEGRDPLRVVLDRKNVSPLNASVFNSDASTLLFTEERRADLTTDQVILRASDDPIPSILSELHRRNIRSLLVEGGAELLGHFISKGLWDEARVITGSATFITGTKAPVLHVHPAHSITSGSDRVDLCFKADPPPAVWSW